MSLFHTNLKILRLALQRLVLICPVRGVLDGVAKEVAQINAIINGQVITIKENDLVGLISEPLVGIKYVGTEDVKLQRN